MGGSSEGAKCCPCLCAPPAIHRPAPYSKDPPPGYEGIIHIPLPPPPSPPFPGSINSAHTRGLPTLLSLPGTPTRQRGPQSQDTTR